jgi:hypothetical protein
MIKKKFSQCVKVNRNSKVTVKENKKQAIFLNPAKEPYDVIHVDGCVIVQNTSCDYVVSKNEVGDILIELKGMDVNHAVEQIMATAQFWSENDFRTGRIAGLVVSSRKPSNDTKIQRFQLAFLKKYKSPLHVWPKNDEFIFENVLEFKGPK